MILLYSSDLIRKITIRKPSPYDVNMDLRRRTVEDRIIPRVGEVKFDFNKVTVSLLNNMSLNITKRNTELNKLSQKRERERERERERVLTLPYVINIKIIIRYGVLLGASHLSGYHI